MTLPFPPADHVFDPAASPEGAAAAAATVPDIDWLATAVQHAPFSVTIADLTLPDRPLVFVNRTFERVTGYAAEFAVGRNCRFLQGPGTAPDALRAIRHALDDGRRLRVELLNYRRDQTPFLNRLTLLPIRNANGRVVACAGYQYPSVTDWTAMAGGT
jgi:PAS domain S-box-containing protein